MCVHPENTSSRLPSRQCTSLQNVDQSGSPHGQLPYAAIADFLVLPVFMRIGSALKATL